MRRDKISESDALARINSQMPLTEKIKQADFVINNNDDIDGTRHQVENIIIQLRSLNTHWKYRIIVFSCTVVPVVALSYGIYTVIYTYLS